MKNDKYNDIEYEPTDDFGKYFVKKCYDDICEKWQFYEQNNPVFKDFIESLDSNQLDNYVKWMEEDMKFGKSSDILYLFDQEAEFYLMDMELDSNNLVNCSLTWVSPSLVGDFLGDWIEKFSKKKGICHEKK